MNTANQSDELIIYEQALNERMRLLLRLEYRLKKFSHKLQQNTHNDITDALFVLLDIFDLCERYDVRAICLKELEKYKIFFEKYHNDSKSSDEKLVNLQKYVKVLYDNLQQISGKFSNYLLKNEFLRNLKNKANMFFIGGHDLIIPELKFWQIQELSAKISCLQNWFGDLVLVEKTVTLILDLLRKNSNAEELLAPQGVYQKNMNIQQNNLQIISVGVMSKAGVYPEISGNKHCITIRFITSSFKENIFQQSFKQNINFILTYATNINT